MYHVKLPAILSVRFANAIIERCEQAILSEDNKVIFDFSPCSFGDPFAITVIVGAIKTAQAKGHKVIYKRSQNKRLEAYFKSIGLYEWGTAQVGKTKFANQQVELQHLSAVQPGYADAVIRVLQNKINMSEGLKGSLHMSVVELMTNTFDHNKSVPDVGCFVCAQAYKDRICLCLTDFGKGILRALSSVEKYKNIETSVEAIELAVQEGVTSRVDRVAGLGLTHIQRFLQVNNGEMHILSQEGWVHWNFRTGKGVVKRRKLRVAFEGTIVNIIARPDGEGFYFLSSEYPGEEEIF
jgi:anti-sigma regulatory factor (Ser/Thr protein kinase)/anti-anti-sigma regulatory factor